MTSTFCKNMKIPIILLFVVSAIAQGSELFAVPEDWAEIELPNPSPNDVTRIEGFSSPDGAITVALMEFKRPIRTENGANEMMQAQLKSFEGTGFKHNFTKLLKVGGYPAMHQQGEMPQPDNDTNLAMDSLAIFTDQVVLSVSIFTDPDVASREEGMACLELVKILGDPIRLTPIGKGIPGDTPEERMGYLVGQVVGFILICLLVVFGIRAMGRKARKDRARIVAAGQAVPPKSGRAGG